MPFDVAWVPEIPLFCVCDTTLGWFIENNNLLLFIILPFHSSLFHSELVHCKAVFEFSMIRFIVWTSLQKSLLHPDCCTSMLVLLTALCPHRQPREKWAGRSRTDCLLPLPSDPLFVSPRVFGTEETRRQGHCPRGLLSKQMLALRLLENFQTNYLSVENSSLNK